MVKLKFRPIIRVDYKHKNSVRAQSSLNKGPADPVATGQEARATWVWSVPLRSVNTLRTLTYIHHSSLFWNTQVFDVTPAYLAADEPFMAHRLIKSVLPTSIQTSYLMNNYPLLYFHQDKRNAITNIFL